MAPHCLYCKTHYQKERQTLRYKPSPCLTSGHACQGLIIKHSNRRIVTHTSMNVIACVFRACDGKRATNQQPLHSATAVFFSTSPDSLSIPSLCHPAGQGQRTQRHQGRGRSSLCHIHHVHCPLCLNLQCGGIYQCLCRHLLYGSVHWNIYYPCPPLYP